MMPASLENMQRGDVVPKRAGGCLNRGARAGRRNDQSEDCDALRASARRLLLRERGAPQNAVRKMKVAEPIDIEFLRAERLQDIFAFHVRRPIREVMEVSGHNWRCRTVNYFCGLSRNRSCERNEKLTGGRSRACRTPGPMSGSTFQKTGKGQGEKCNRRIGQMSIRRRCGSFSRAACPNREQPMPSISSGPKSHFNWPLRAHATPDVCGRHFHASRHTDCARFVVGRAHRHLEIPTLS